MISCYVAAIPFFGNTVAADLLGTAVLFGLAPLFERASPGLARPRLAEITSDAHCVRAVSARLNLAQTNHVAKLLVSVRSGVEALAALAGGADVIDVKEPSHGPLGRAEFALWREVRGRVPPTVPMSVALGELSEWSDADIVQVPHAAMVGTRLLQARIVAYPAGLDRTLARASSATCQT